MLDSGGQSVSEWIRDHSPPGSLPLDQEAARAFERARWIGLETGDEGPPVTFTTLLVALMGEQDAASRWFQKQARSSALQSCVLSEKRLSQKVLEAGWTRADAGRNAASGDTVLTVSARAVLRNAEGWAQRVGGSDIGVRHLLAAYLVNPPPNHRKQMQGWQFDEATWRDQFFDWVAPNYGWEQWAEARQRPAPTRGLPMVGLPQITGGLLAWPGDADAMRVLEVAARYHARSGDTWLRVRTLLFALVEAARSSPAVRDDILPIYSSIERVDEHYRSKRDQEYPETRATSKLEAFDDLQVSPRVLNALETARELAAVSGGHGAGGGRGRVHPVRSLHLAGALLSRRVDAGEELVMLGLDPQKLRIALLRHAVDGLNQHEESWREALGEEEAGAVSGRPVDLNSDDAGAVVTLDHEWKNDPLAIRADVEAFASLLASTKLQPPLAIGLFGPWRSGKTTFLQRLRQSVDRRVAPLGAVPAPQTDYVSHVVHVEFNAWHFAEGALVSSLVDTIFRRLTEYASLEPSKDGKDGKPLLEAMRGAAETARLQLEASSALNTAALDAVEAAKSALVASESAAARELITLRAALRGAWDAAKSELATSKVVKASGVLDELDSTFESAEQLRARIAAIRSRPVRLSQGLGWAGGALLAALVLALPPLVAWLTNKLIGTQELGKAVSLLTGLVSAMGLWVQTAARAAARADTALAQVTTHYEERLARDETVIQAKQSLEKAQHDAAMMQTRLAAARSALAHAQTEAVNAELPAQLLRLVTGRIEDKTYEKELTTLSLARADLARLSTILRDQRSGVAPETQSNARRVDRVILYVDDLDRCEPKKVVEILRTVHMLLSFDLFVVVVAVDARWVEEAVRRSYPWLTDGSQGSTQLSALNGKAALGYQGVSEVGDMGGMVAPHGSAHDYLEKIFQIAFWLEPMDASRAASYLESLVRRAPRSQLPEVPVLASGASGQPPSVSVPSGNGGPVLDITPLELDYMRALAAHVGPSPRSVKRLVNVYRLLKARLSDDQLEAFVRSRDTGGDGPYQIVIGLLVIGTGAQLDAAPILRALAEWDPGSRYDDVIQELRRRKGQEWAMAARVIETLKRTQRASDVAELRGWARKVGRFLLRGPIRTFRQTATSANAL